MLKITPNQKQTNKYFQDAGRLKPIPQTWEEFVSLMKIRSGAEMLPFKPYEYQKILVRLMWEFNNLVVVKSRQLGTTQAVSSKFLHDTCCNPASSSVAFMRNDADVGSLSRRLKQMLSGLTEFATCENNQVGYIKLKGLGDFYIKNSSREGTRSLDSVQNFLFDEAAFVENISHIYAASSPSGALVGNDLTKCIVSTPSAKSGWYWDRLTENNDGDVEEICQRVARGELYSENLPGLYYWVDKAGVCKVVLHWRCHPIYLGMDQSHPGGYLAYRQKQDGTDDDTIQREYNLSFVDSSVAIFTTELVRSCFEDFTLDERRDGAIYFLGLDCATVGSDYLCASVIEDYEGKLRVADYYRKRKETSEVHLYHLGELIRKWQPRKISVEITGGVGTLYLEQLAKQFKSIAVEAIRTTGDSKPQFVSTLILAMEKGLLKFNEDKILIDELLSFRREGKKLEAAQGKHDDLIMSVMFALQGTDFAKPDELKPFFDINAIGSYSMR